MTDTMTTPHDLKRIVRQYRNRRWAFYDRVTGHMAEQWRAGGVRHGQPQASMAALLQWCVTAYSGSGEDMKIRVLYITGGQKVADIPGYNPKDDRALERYWTAPLAKGWAISSFIRDPMHVTYTRGNDTVDVLMGDTWYGAEHDALKCAQAHELLTAMLRNKFDHKAALMTTPGRTGADLFQRSLPAGHVYPPLDDGTRAILEHNFSQGRIEMPGFYRKASCQDGLYVLDARLMYTTALRHLPIGPAKTERKSPVYAGYRKGVYRVSTRVPDNWSHIGLAPVWSDQEQRPVWPHRPGQYIDDCWLTGAELALLYDAGWPVNIKTSILYAPEDAPGNDPGRAFVTALQEVIAWAELNSNLLVRSAARRLMINCVGYWHRSHRVSVRWAPRGQESTIPADSLLILPMREGIRYTVQTPLDASVDALYRPEMAVQVWGASRAKLNRQALSVPSQRVLWLRHDSLVLDYDPGWWDDGKAGRWRVKRHVPGPVDAPLTEESYRKLLQEAE